MDTLLRALRRLAQALLPWRGACLLLAAAGFALFGWGALSAGAGADTALIPGLLLATWALLLYVVLSLFPAVPDAPHAALGWWQRLRRRAVRGLYLLLALLVLLGAAVAVRLTLSLLNLWLDGG